YTGVELYEKTLGIVGLGRIGGLVAERAKAFGMRLVGYDPYITQARAAQMGVELLHLPGLLAVSDFVTVHLPKTPDTIGLTCPTDFRAAAPGARFINVGRGGIIDEEALAEAIASGRFGGAGIGVWNTDGAEHSALMDLAAVDFTSHL